MEMMKWVQMAEGTAIRFDGETYGPGVGENPRSDTLVQVPMGFPDRFDISGGAAQRIVDAGLADAVAAIETPGSASAPAAPTAPPDVPLPVVSPIPNPGTAAFSADDFLSALRAEGVTIPATGENGSVTLADVLGVLSNDATAEAPADVPAAAPVETPAPETPVAAPIDAPEVSEVPSATETPAAPIVEPVAPVVDVPAVPVTAADVAPVSVTQPSVNTASDAVADVADVAADTTPDAAADAAPAATRRSKSA